MPWAEWQQHYVCAHGTYMQTHVCTHPAVCELAVHSHRILTVPASPPSPAWAHHHTSTSSSPGKANCTPTSLVAMKIQYMPQNKRLHTLLARLWSQHGTPPSLPCPCTALGLHPSLLVRFSFLLLYGSSFSCVQTAPVSSVPSRGNFKSRQASHDLVTPMIMGVF